MHIKSVVYQAGITNLNDRVSHVQNLIPHALHSAVQHVVHRLDCVLGHNDQRGTKFVCHRHAKV